MHDRSNTREPEDRGRNSPPSLSLAQNTAVNVLSKGASTALALFVSAYVVHRLGLATFGFWAVISAVAQYAALLDFGVGFSLVRFIAQAHETGDDAGLVQKAASGLWSSLAFFLAAIVLGALTVAGLALTHPGSYPNGWEAAVVLAAANLGLASVTSVFQAFPGAFGRWDWSSYAVLAGQAVYSALAVLLLEAGGGIAALAAALTAGTATTLLCAYLAKRRLSRDSLRLRHVRRREIRELWSYGISVQLVNLVAVINTQADKLVLLPFASLSFIGLYELGARAAYMIRSLPLSALGPLMAESARTAARTDSAGLAGFYLRSYRGVLALAFAPLAALLGASYALVVAWVGTGFRTSGVIAVVLGAGYAFNVATAAGTTLAMGAGRPDIDRNYSLLGLALNLVLTVALGVTIGKWGVIVATTVGVVVSSIWLLRLVDRWLGTRVLSGHGFAGSRGSAYLSLWGVLIGGAIATVSIVWPVPSRGAALALAIAGLAIFIVGWLPTTVRMGLITLPRPTLRGEQ